ncbi:peptidyl-prolyl cis-trans isomerase, FKBP-type, N-terminal domain protein [Providencia alcalifaciens R90-1475]|nr:peptidyl-prolyl cis-trans isomerase, FKBP-type, N-terminal domain protein [Providencia alcalifaciens R90-1475]
MLEYAKKRSIEGHTKTNNTQIGSYNNNLKFQLKQLEVENTKLKKSIEKLKLEIKESITYNEKITSEFDEKQKKLMLDNEIKISLLNSQIDILQSKLAKSKNSNSEKFTKWLTLLVSSYKDRVVVENRQLKNENKHLELEIKKLEKENLDISVEDLDIPEIRQSYATGVMIGDDIKQFWNIQNYFNVKTDQRAFLAGVKNALSLNVFLSDDEIQNEVASITKHVESARQRLSDSQKKIGDEFRKKYRLKNGVNLDESGYLYQIEYLGDGEFINDELSIVEVSVIEKLIDGTIIEDMDLSGKTLALSLSDYPPVFKSAIKKIKNHGTITIVVPSSLAYGDEGNLPKIPPGATVIYTIRIESVEKAQG